jgi:hypothetical protein
MTSVRATMRAGYYVAKILPKFLWLPVEMRKHLRRATDAFEDELRQSGVDPDTAHELAKTYHEANKQVISKITSPKAWARTQQVVES